MSILITTWERKVMIRLVYNVPDEHTRHTAVRSVDINIADEATLTEMLEAYEQFLLACGYQLTGKLDIIPEDEYYGND